MMNPGKVLRRVARPLGGRSFALLILSGALAGCGSLGAGVGLSVPVGPLSVGVGWGTGGPTLGVGTAVGPVGVGVGVNQQGQVHGGAGVGVSAPVGSSGASVGVGVGAGTVLHDPNAAARPVAPPAQ
jgi:hypothetical protein